MSLKKNIIYLYFKGKHLITSKSQYQYNRGQYLYFADLNLPQAFEVHFSNKDRGESKTQIGSNKLVEIPDEYFWSGALEIYAWVYLHSGTDDGETIYEVKIPLIKRAKPTDEEPLPVQRSAIDKAIAELNNAVDITNENADKTNADKTQVASIKEEVVILKEDIDSTARAVSQDAQSARESADASEQSAQNSAESERKALDYSDEAKGYAQSALESKNTASQKAQVASDASAEAKDFRDEAETFKNEAEQAKQNIVDYRNETKGYRDEALTAKDEVQTIKGDIQSLKTQIDDTADNVFENAREAYQSMISADNASLNASESAENASQSAINASESANQAEEFKNQSATNVAHYPKVVDGYWYVWDANNNEYINTNVDARGVKGDKGDVGNGIENTVLNSDYTLTITFTDGTSYTTPSIRGEKGIKGDIGNGIASTVLNDDYTLTLTFTDGTTYTTPSIRGEKGEQGEPATDMEIHICSTSEYDSETRIPTITSPDDKTFYLVPTKDGTSPDLFTEWVYVNDAWEMFGSASVDLSGYLTDVQINDESIVENGVANIPIANNTLGAVRINNGQGFVINPETGQILIYPAVSNIIKQGTEKYRPIIPCYQHESTFYGLAKVAGSDEKDSTLPVGQYTDEAKSSIQSMLDVPSNADLDEVEEKVEQNTEDLLKAFPVETASGSIASFEDGAYGIPLQSLVVDINPVQDLHGYDSPWVGGGGKNIFNKNTVENSKWLNVSTGAIENTTANYSLSDYIPVKANLPYVFTNPNSSRRWFYDSNKQPVEQISNNPYTPSADGYILLTISVGGNDPVNLDTFQFEQGTTLSAYSPYENICPISGWTGVDIEQSGANLWDEKWEVGTITSGTDSASSVTLRSKNYIPVVSGQTYYFSAPNSKAKYIYCYDSDKAYTGTTLSVNALSAFTVPSGCSYIRFAYVYYIQDYATYNHDISINYPSTDHDYHTYTGRSIPISWQTEAGTVYGVKLDVLSGVMTVEMAMVDLGTLEWYKSTSPQRFESAVAIDNCKAPTLNSDVADILVECYKTVSANTTNENSAIAMNTAGLLRIYDSGKYESMSRQEFKTAMSGVQLLYPLATPIEIQLDGHTLNSLYGVNNIFADTGNISVEYCADTEMYIEKVKPVVNVDDVQVNGVSIINDNIANIPLASSGTFGVVKIDGNYGIQKNSSNLTVINRGNDSEIKLGTNSYKPIVPYSQHMATFYGLAKASGDTTQSTSSNTVGNYTDNAKDKIQNMLGVSPLIAPHETDPFESNHAIGELFIINGKLYRAKTALTVGEYINEGTNVEVVDVAGVLDDTYVKNTDYAVDRGEGGIVKVNRSLGISASLGTLGLAEISSTTVKDGSSQYYAISPRHQHESVFYGLAKAAGYDEKDSTLPVGTYTPEAKSAIKQMLSIADNYDSFIVDVEGTDPTITGQPSYRYNCGEVLSLTVTPPETGTIDFRFTSGSSPTVLTLPSTVKMPEWWVEVEANTIYEMCITDGVYCGVMSWAI